MTGAEHISGRSEPRLAGPPVACDVRIWGDGFSLIPPTATRAAAAAIERELMSGVDYATNLDSEEQLAKAALIAALPHLQLTGLSIECTPHNWRARLEGGKGLPFLTRIITEHAAAMGSTP